MEAAFVNTVGLGDVVVVGVNGLFGVRMCDVASRCGAEVVRVDAPWGQPLDVDAGCPRTRHRSSSPQFMPRRPRASATTSQPSQQARAMRCFWPTASRRWPESSWPSTTGPSTSPIPAPRSASAWPRACRRSPSTSVPGTADRTSAVLVPRSGHAGGYVGAATGGGGRTYHHTAPTAMVASLHAGLAGCPRRAWTRSSPAPTSSL